MSGSGLARLALLTRGFSDDPIIDAGPGLG